MQIDSYSNIYMHIYLIMSVGVWASQVMLVVKNLPVKAGAIRYVVSVLGLGRSSGGGHGNPLQYDCLENPRDSGAWRATVHGVAKSWA